MKRINASVPVILLALLTSLSACAGDKFQKAATDTPAISDTKAEKLAETLRWELNNYGPASSNDDIDYQVVEVLNAGKGESDAGTNYTITVKFNTSAALDEANMIVYKGMISESTDGHLNVTGYESED